MKRFLIVLSLLLLMLVSMLVLFSCDAESDGGGEVEGDPVTDAGDGTASESEDWIPPDYVFDVKFRMPGQNTLFTAKGKKIKGVSGINLSADALKNDKYFSNEQFRGYSFTQYTHRATYLGLFTEPDGGIMCFDAEGRNVSKGNYPSSSIYYARFDRGKIPISYSGIDDPAAHGLPTSVKYGDPLGVTSLPVIEKEGYRFLYWETSGRDGYEATNSKGELLGNYLIVNDSNYSAILTKDFGVRFIPVYEEIAPELDITLTLIYNDGTQRVKYKEWSSEVKLRATSLPTGNGALKILKGWSLTPSGTEPFEGYLTEDTTLYAIWAERRYICVSLTAGDEVLCEVVEGETTVLPTPTREGYEFTGWFTNELRTGMPVSGEVEYSHPYEYYYAGWQKID